MKILLFTLLALGLSALCALPAEAASIPYHNWCKTSNLSVKPEQTGMAAGTAGFFYVLQNHGKKNCVIGGFPELHALDKDGKTIKSIKFKRTREIWSDPDQPAAPKRITLAPGKEAWFQVVYSTGDGLQERSECRAIEAIRIGLPGNHKSLVDHKHFEACSIVHFTALRNPVH